MVEGVGECVCVGWRRGVFFSEEKNQKNFSEKTAFFFTVVRSYSAQTPSRCRRSDRPRGVSAVAICSALTKKQSECPQAPVDRICAEQRGMRKLKLATKTSNRNVHHLTILCNSTASNLETLVVQHNH